MSGTEDTDKAHRSYKSPHSARNPVPTIQQYRDFKQKQRDELEADSQDAEVPDAKEGTGARQYIRDYWYGSKADEQNQQGEGTEPSEEQSQVQASSGELGDDTQNGNTEESNGGTDDQDIMPDTSQSVPPSDPKANRKRFKNREAAAVEREVTDPITHLPVTIHDFTENDMKERLPDSDEEDDNEASNQSIPGLQERGKSKSGIERATKSLQEEHKSMENRFPPPTFDLVKSDLAAVYQRGTLYGVIPLLAGALVFGLFALILPDYLTVGRYTFQDRTIMAALGVSGILVTAGIMWALLEWSQMQVRDIWDDAVWQARNEQMQKQMSGGTEETTLWLSKLVGSLWPLINPDLFASVADTLEDVMQASLPKLVRMVSVDDLGQGSEALQILGINWLPKGAAGRSVTANGELKPEKKSGQEPGTGGSSDGKEKSDADKEDERHSGGDDLREGMEAEEGEFVNLELAFAYRGGRLKNKVKDRAKNAHLYLAFYLPANIKLLVGAIGKDDHSDMSSAIWVELKALIGICRLRLQLAPDPPFVQLCTLTFLGQPRVNIKCMPLLKKGPNIMDLPLISNFVQSSVNAALSEYVAPKSITLDLQAMLAGDDFKRDTSASGVLVVRIKRAYDFKAGDLSMPIIGNGGSSDPYVSVGWAKFGKPIWSTRVIAEEMEPYWEEECHVLVGPEEIDADENLRLSLNDSDKMSADDDLGRIELGLKHLMRDKNSNGKMWDRSDAFRAVEAGGSMPGRCEWSVGYFSKTRLLKCQMDQQKKDRDLESIDQLREETYKAAARKVREASKQNESEVKQIQEDDWENLQTQMISDSLPPEDYPSGILSVQVHQCVGLQVEKLNKSGKDIPDGEQTDITDDNESLPDGYCTIILNHQKIFKTRTKPKNSAPFFNAGTERFISDWRTTQLDLSVRDARVHEDDPLLGFVHIDIGELLRSRRASRINDYFPLAGGIGYGRLRVSIVFRSVQLQAPAEALGWNLGTLEIGSDIYGAEGLPKELITHHLKLRTSLTKHRIKTGGRRDSYEHEGLGEGSECRWNTGNARANLLPVEARYASNLTIEFRSGAGILGSDKAPAAAILWLSTIPDEEWVDVTLPVWRTDKAMLKRLMANQLPYDKCGEKLGVLRFKARFWRGLGTGHVKTLAKRYADVRNVVEVLNGAHDQGVITPMVGDNGWRQARKKECADRSAAAEAAARDDRDGDDSANDSDSSDDDGEKHAHHGKERAKPNVNATDANGVANGHHQTRSGNKHDSAIDTKGNKTPPASTRSSYAEGTPSSATTTTTEDTRSALTPSTSSVDGGVVNATKDYLHDSSSLHRRHRGIMQWKGSRTLAWMKHKADKSAEQVKERFEQHRGPQSGIETEV